MGRAWRAICRHARAHCCRSMYMYSLVAAAQRDDMTDASRDREAVAAVQVAAIPLNLRMRLQKCEQSGCLDENH